MTAPTLHARVTIPDGRTGRVVGTKAGLASPACVQVRIDGSPAVGPHPWFLARDVQIEQKEAAE